MAPARRYERRKVTGAQGWEVNSQGVAYKHRHIQPITDELAGLPTLDLGKDYKGPIPSASLQSSRYDPHRLLEEIVAWEFLGPAHGGVRGLGGMMVVHLDGDSWNCAADNLSWD